MMKYISFLALPLLAGCATLPRLSDGVTLSIRTYDPATGDFVMELRNETVRPILYLNPYLTFHTIRSPDPEPFPDRLAMVQVLNFCPWPSADMRPPQVIRDRYQG